MWHPNPFGLRRYAAASFQREAAECRKVGAYGMARVLIKWSKFARTAAHPCINSMEFIRAHQRGANATHLLTSPQYEES